jgi:hypothetical protein
MANFPYLLPQRAWTRAHGKDGPGTAAGGGPGDGAVWGAGQVIRVHDSVAKAVIAAGE